MSSHVLRGSYSLLKAWSEGRVDDAIAMYLHADERRTQQMEDGIRWHKQWEEEVNRESAWPSVFGGRKIALPFRTEWKLERPVTDWMSFRGVIDLIEFKESCGEWPVAEICDFKTGLSSAADYASSYQLPLYAWLLQFHKVRCLKGRYLHWDQYASRADTCLVHITDRRLAEAVEWAVSVGSEMYSSFEDMGMFDREETV